MSIIGLINTLLDHNEIYEKQVKPVLYKSLGLGFIFVIQVLITGSIIYFLNPDFLKDYYNSSLIFLLSLLSSLILWGYIRKLPKFAPDEIGILIALSLISEEADKELLLLYKKLESILSKELVKSKVKLKLLPPRFLPRNEEGAHNIRKKAKARLIVWGDVDSGNLESEKQTLFKPIYFSYTMNLPKDRVEIFNRNFSAILAQRKWVISDRNNIIDREYLANNIEEVAFYILGLVLYFSNEISQSLDLLIATLKKYKQRNNLTINDQIAIQNISIVTGFIYDRMIKSLNLWPSSDQKVANIERAKQIITELNSIEFKGKSLLLQGVIVFLQGDVDGAINLIKLGKNELSDKDPAPHLSLAFLYYHKGDLKNGLIELQNAIKSTRLLEMGDQSVSIIRWYEDILKDYPEKFYLNYPLGILYYELSGDKVLARKCFDLFVRSYSEDKTKIINQMKYEIEKRLRKMVDS